MLIGKLIVIPVTNAFSIRSLIDTTRFFLIIRSFLAKRALNNYNFWHDSGTKIINDVILQ